MAVSFRYLAGSWSGPDDFEGFMFWNCLITPSTPKVISGISGYNLLVIGTFFVSSSVKTDWNCSFSVFAFAVSEVAGIPDLVLKVGIPHFSFRRALI